MSTTNFVSDLDAFKSVVENCTENTLVLTLEEDDDGNKKLSHGSELALLYYLLIGSNGKLSNSDAMIHRQSPAFISLLGYKCTTMFVRCSSAEQQNLNSSLEKFSSVNAEADAARKIFENMVGDILNTDIFKERVNELINLSKSGKPDGDVTAEIISQIIMQQLANQKIIDPDAEQANSKDEASSTDKAKSSSNKKTKDAAKGQSSLNDLIQPESEQKKEAA